VKIHSSRGRRRAGAPVPSGGRSRGRRSSAAASSAASVSSVRKPVAFTGIAAIATGLAAAVVLPLIQPAEPDAGSHSDTKTFTTTGSVAAATSSTTPAYDRPTVDSKAASTGAASLPAEGSAQPTAGAVPPHFPGAGGTGPAKEAAPVPTSDGTAPGAPATGSTPDTAAPATGPVKARTAAPTATPESTGTAGTPSSAPASPRSSASATPTERSAPERTQRAERSVRAKTSVTAEPTPSTGTAAPGILPEPAPSLGTGKAAADEALRKLRAVRGETVDDPNWRWIRSHLDGRGEELRR
jgi:hypothetical protein